MEINNSANPNKTHGDGTRGILAKGSGMETRRNKKQTAVQICEGKPWIQRDGAKPTARERDSLE